jgi:hypothetical protein
VIQPEEGHKGDYIALSHCWGDPTHQDEIQRWAADPENLLPLDKWPKTFQEAVYIPRSLEIPYLWVDTACINQKDEKDFAREAAKWQSTMLALLLQLPLCTRKIAGKAFS